MAPCYAALDWRVHELNQPGMRGRNPTHRVVLQDADAVGEALGVGEDVGVLWSPHPQLPWLRWRAMSGWSSSSGCAGPRNVVFGFLPLLQG